MGRRILQQDYVDHMRGCREIPQKQEVLPIFGIPRLNSTYFHIPSINAGQQEYE
jgi:hypothetical protein